MLNNMKILAAIGTMAIMGAAGSASAAPFILNYIGSSTSSGSPFTTILNLDVASSGAIATLISGSRNGVAVTALTGYASADNKLTLSNPYVDFGGLSFAVTGGEAFNFYSHNGQYYEDDSIDQPNGLGPDINPVSFASVNGVIVAGSVPEPTTWAMMFLGIGAIGLSTRLAKLRRGSSSVSRSGPALTA